MATYSLTYAQIKTEVNARLGNRNDSDISTRLANIINEAYMQILYNKRFLFHELEKRAITAMVPGTQEYGIPGDCLYILGLFNITSKRPPSLVKEHWFEWQRSNISLTQSYPFRYARAGASIFLRPPPKTNDTILLWYIKKAPLLSADGDIPALPSDWHHGLILAAAESGHDAFREPDLIAGPQSYGGATRFDKWLADKMTAKDYEMVHTDMGMKIRIR